MLRITGLLLFLLAGCGPIAILREVTTPYQPRTVSNADYATPVIDRPDRPNAVLVMGSHGTEVTDLLGPYDLLSASDAFDVFVVAPHTDPAPANLPVAIVPHLDFAAAPRADLLVVPAVIEPEEDALLAFVKSRAPEATRLLSICEGARVLAAAGLLDGLNATTHFFALPGLQRDHPQVRFAPGYRYVADGRTVSSAGVTAGFDATLFVIEQMAGPEAAARAASRLGYTWLREADPSGNTPREARFGLSGWRIAGYALRASLDPFPETVAVALYPGVSAMAVAAALDTHPRTLRARARTVSLDDSPVRTRFGLLLVADSTREELAEPDRVVIPHGAPEAGTAGAWDWPPGTPVHDLRARPEGQAVLDHLRIVRDVAGPYLSSIVATQLEQPFEPREEP